MADIAYGILNISADLVAKGYIILVSSVESMFSISHRLVSLSMILAYDRSREVCNKIQD